MDLRVYSISNEKDLLSINSWFLFAATFLTLCSRSHYHILFAEPKRTFARLVLILVLVVSHMSIESVSQSRATIFRDSSHILNGLRVISNSLTLKSKYRFWETTFVWVKFLKKISKGIKIKNNDSKKQLAFKLRNEKSQQDLKKIKAQIMKTSR
jgi:hypothetical protein